MMDRVNFNCRMRRELKIALKVHARKRNERVYKLVERFIERGLEEEYTASMKQKIEAGETSSAEEFLAGNLDDMILGTWRRVV